MWSSVLGLALLSGLNLVRIGLTLLVISRPRPVRNLLAFSAGCLTGGVPVIVVPLILLHTTTLFADFAQDTELPTSNGTIRHVQIGLGLVALTLAAVVSMRGWRRRRRRALASLRTTGVDGNRAGNATSTLVLDTDASATDSPVGAQPTTEEGVTAFRRMLHRAREIPAEDASLFRRALHRAHKAWEDGSLWIASVMGMVFGGPPPGEALFLMAIIATSGAAVGTQIAAAVVYAVGMLAVIELMLIGYVAAPTKSHALLSRLHDWSVVHRQRVLVTIFLVVATALFAQGFGLV